MKDVADIGGHVHLDLARPRGVDQIFG